RIAISTLITMVVVLQLWTLPLEISLGSKLKESRFLTCPGAPLVVSSIGICRTPTVMGQMANSVALVAFRSTQTIRVIVAFGAQRFRSSIRFLLTRPNSTSFYSQSDVQQKCGSSYPLAQLQSQLHLALSLA
nr:hypothetical protein [Tanacetum cinerariifolium]